MIWLRAGATSAALESATTTMCGRLNGGFFYFLLSHIIYHCSLSSLRRGKSVKLEEQLPSEGRSNMRNGLSKEERETQEGGADGETNCFTDFGGATPPTPKPFIRTMHRWRSCMIKRREKSRQAAITSIPLLRHDLNTEPDTTDDRDFFPENLEEATSWNVSDDKIDKCYLDIDI